MGIGSSGGLEKGTKKIINGESSNYKLKKGSKCQSKQSKLYLSPLVCGERVLHRTLVVPATSSRVPSEKRRASTLLIGQMTGYNKI